MTAADIASHDPYTDTIPGCFERIAAAFPGNLAVGGVSWQPTFAELNIVSNRLAHAVLRCAVAPGDRVAIVMGHDAPMVAAVIGALKAGCVATVFNTTDPPARLEQMAENAEPAVIFVEARHREIAAGIARNAVVLCFEDIASDGPSHNPALEISSDQPAFVVYTSGSTGRPNGIMHNHGAAIANAQAAARMLEASPNDRFLLLASISGGQGINTAFAGLLSGASLWPFLALEKGVHGLADYVTENEITVCTWSASIFRHMVMTIGPDRRFPAVHAVRLASERATLEDFQAFQRHFSAWCTLNYTLASSEAGHIAYLALRPGDNVGDGALPIGRLQDRVTVELLDSTGRPVPHGEPGELVVTSRSVTTGYWRNPQLTAERCSVPSDARHRTLRTGDLVRWNEAGVLEFVGRLQRRVKIRGYTIELLEVDQALRTVPGVTAATSSVFELPKREPQLVSFIIRDRVSQAGATVQPATLRRLLRALLPRPMVPSTFLFVDEIPLNANGKVDPSKLRELYETRERNNSDRPTTDTEVMIARIWGDLLGLDDIGRQDDFFDLGGDSLTASVTAAWLQAETGAQLDLAMFATHPTLEMMAALVDSLRSEASAPGVAELVPSATPEGPAPLSFSQQFYWDTSQTTESAAQHTVVGHFRLIGSLDRDVLTGALQTLYRRHEMLRTSFREVDGRAVQIVDPAATLSVPFFDLSTDPDAAASARAMLSRDTQRGFDLKQLPLVAFKLARLYEREHWLLFGCHHIVSDGFSWRVFVRELSEIYDAKINGAQDILPVARQFSEFARWQRKEFQPDSPAYREALMWLTDEHLRAAYPSRSAYRKLLLWFISRSYPQASIRNTLIGFLLRTGFMLPAPPAKPLPFRRRVPEVAVDPKEGLIGWRFPPDVAQRIDMIGRGEGATHFVVRLAVSALLLSEAIGSPAVAIGSYFTNRDQPRTRDVFGFCVNLMTFNLLCDGNLTFRQFLRAVSDKIHGLQMHCNFPHDELQRMMRAWKIKPLRNTIHVSIATPVPPVRIRDLEFIDGDDDVPPGVQDSVELKFAGANDIKDNQVRFNANVYDSVAMRDFVSRLIRLFDVASNNPDLRLPELIAMSGRMSR